jgi:membrane protease YdiL (CAAX protease family)
LHLPIRSTARWIKRQNAGLRILVFLGMLLVLWGPGSLIIHYFGNMLGQPDGASTLALIGLYGCFIGLLRGWGQQVHGWHRPLQRCGLRWSRQFWFRWLIALVVGLGAVSTLFSLELLAGWAILQGIPGPFMGIVLQGLGVALAVGFAEELLFRGWLLAELEQDCSPGVALVINSAVFALAHFIKPFSEVLRTAPQFLGLFLLGLALGWARRTPGRGNSQSFPDVPIANVRGTLALPIGLHGGLVWGYYMVDVGDLIQYSGRVPEWLTGIDANPLAGVLGLIMLGGIAVAFARASDVTRP